MNNIQIKQFNKRLDKLEKFAKDQEENYKEPEIIDWISDCINVFYEIGVDTVIIRHFLDYFSFGFTDIEITGDLQRLMRKDKEFEKVKSIGPFFEVMKDELDYNPGGPRISSGEYSLKGSFYYAKVAFSAARNVLKSKIEEKRIVPFWLIEQTAKQDDTKHLASSLELIENKYKHRDSDGLATESVTLLDSILKLDTELKTKSRIGDRLRSLIEDLKKLERVPGVSKDLAIGPNCGRIIRNEKIIHKNTPVKYDFPFLIATSFAYLVLFFIE